MATTSTTMVASTTTTTPTFDVTYFVRVYDLFELPDGNQGTGSRCTTYGDSRQISEGARAVLRQDGTATSVATGLFSEGRLAYDSTGPSPGSPDAELFRYCNFDVAFEGAQLEKGGLYYVEIPGYEDAGHPLTKGDLLGSIGTAVFQTDLEDERNRIRG